MGLSIAREVSKNKKIIIRTQRLDERLNRHEVGELRSTLLLPNVTSSTSSQKISSLFSKIDF